MTIVADYTDMPQEMTFESLIAHPLYHNYSEYSGRWAVILSNGWYYKGILDSEIGHLCGPLDRLDPCALAGFGQLG